MIKTEDFNTIKEDYTLYYQYDGIILNQTPKIKIMKKWYSILFFHLCQWHSYRLQKCNNFCVLYICSILFFIVSSPAIAKSNSNIIHQDDLSRAFGLGTMMLSNSVHYDGNKIALQNTAVKSVAHDSLILQNGVPYISIVLIMFVLILVVKFLVFPEVNFDQNQIVTRVSVFQQISGLFRRPQFVLGLIVLTLYFNISSEVLNCNSIDGFIKKFQTYGGEMDYYQKLILSTMTAMVIGCILGMVIDPKYIFLKVFLKLSCLLGVLSAAVILFISSSTMISISGIPDLPLVIVLVSLMGFVNGLCWPVIWAIIFKDFMEYN